MGDRRFVVELIKPSHYDDDGYVIQWWKSWIPSNSLASLYGIATDIAARRALGPDVSLELRAYDECHTVIPIGHIIRRIKAADAGLVCLVGVQSNQFPRAMDLAAPFRAAGIAVAIGGFHVSGCLAMLPRLPPDLEAAGRWELPCSPARPRAGSKGSSPMRLPAECSRSTTTWTICRGCSSR